jgi:hypothetical protein
MILGQARYNCHLVSTFSDFFFYPNKEAELKLTSCTTGMHFIIFTAVN